MRSQIETRTVEEQAERLRQVRGRYLDLLEKTLKDAVYGETRLEAAWRRIGHRLRHPYLTRGGAPPWPRRAHAMIPAARLHHLRELMERTIAENIPGDYIETGVWRGGACILMRGVLEAYGARDRRVFCADTFAGLPRPDGRYPSDRRMRLHAFKELAVSEEMVRRNFAGYDLLDEQVVFVRGLFKETLPRLESERFALIRLDGDMYESTMDALTHLYDRVSAGGFVIVDDYGALKSCSAAVHDFLDARGLRPEMQAVDASCVWWRKGQ